MLSKLIIILIWMSHINSAGWLSQLNDQLWPWSQSHSSWVLAPCWALSVLTARSLEPALESVFPSLSAPLLLLCLCLSLSLKNKYTLIFLKEWICNITIFVNITKLLKMAWSYFCPNISCKEKKKKSKTTW